MGGGEGQQSGDSDDLRNASNSHGVPTSSNKSRLCGTSFDDSFCTSSHTHTGVTLREGNGGKKKGQTNWQSLLSMLRCAKPKYVNVSKLMCKCCKLVNLQTLPELASQQSLYHHIWTTIPSDEISHKGVTHSNDKATGYTPTKITATTSLCHCLVV